MEKQMKVYEGWIVRENHPMFIGYAVTALDASVTDDEVIKTALIAKFVQNGNNFDDLLVKKFWRM